MSKITRFDGDYKAFASEQQTNERTTFGTEVISDDLTAQQTPEYLRGMGIVGPSQFPTLQDFNAANYTATQSIAYLHQMGMPEWSAGQEYQIDSAANRNGSLYFCQTADHVSAAPPESDPVNWTSESDLIDSSLGEKYETGAGALTSIIKALDLEKLKFVNTIKELVEVDPILNPQVSVAFYHSIVNKINLSYVWVGAQSKTVHNGGTVIDPDIPFPATWTGDYLDPVNTGSGCWVATNSGPLCASWFGTIGDDTTDDTNSIKKWISEGAATKREIYGDVNGKCKLTETIYIPTETVLRTGSGGRNGEGFTLKAYHTGAAVVSLKGAVGVFWDVLNLETDASIFPKTGICLGRDSAASAGHHKLGFTRFQGYTSVAPIYSIASEVNYWGDMYIWNLGGGAKHVFYTSEQDDHAVDSLVKSTNIQGTFKQQYLLNSSTDPDSSCIYVEAGPNTGDWNFDGYLIPSAGSYARVNVNVANFPDAPGVLPFVPGGITFRFGGERLGPTGNPMFGVRITTDTAVKIKNFGFTNSRFDFQAGSDKWQLFIDDDVILETPNVVLGAAEAFAYAQASFNQNKILGGIYSVGRLSLWAELALSGAWVNVNGAPYAPASISIDGFRNVKLRGYISSGSGLITTLPNPFRPAENMLFNVVLGAPPSASFGQLLLESNGNLSLQAGSDSVDLSQISFRV